MSFDKGEWRPNKKQELFLSLPWTIKEGMFGGGAGSGKSDLLLIYPLAHKLHENPNFKQVFMRRTFPELRTEIVPRSRELYRKFGANFNRTEMLWTFPREDQYGTGVGGSSNGGASIFLAHCEDENDVHKYDSMEINLYTPDELTSFTEFIYLYIGFTRVRTSDPKLPAIIRSAAMPGGIGHSFVKKRFVDHAKLGGKVIIGKGGNKRFYVHATLADNSHIDPGYAQSLEALPEAEKKAKKYGDWEAYLGSVFEEFRTLHYPDEPENALHVIPEFEIPAWWPRIVIGDWGFRAMTWIGFAAISPQKRIYIYREMYWLKTKIEEWAPEVKYWIDKENPRVVKFCKSAGQDRGQEHTIQEQISTALGVPIELTSNSPGSRVAGKLLLHEYFRWKPIPIPATEKLIFNEERALWIYRNRGEKEYRSYLASFAPPKEEVLPKIQIFSQNTVLIGAIQACVYAKARNNKPAEDVAEFDGDDPYDGLRYIVDSAEKYFDEAQEEFEKVVKQAAILHQLQTTQDMTAYYRNMRTNESLEGIQAVRRYR